MSISVNWNYPTNIVFGCGRVKEIVSLCKSRSINNPLVVTDSGLVTLPVFKQFLSHFEAEDQAYDVYSQVKPNPDEENVNAGVKIYQEGRHDAVIAFGGGSALDAGKAIALMAGQSRVIWDFEDVDDNWTRVNSEGVAPIIAIPTTAGTGSEVGRASVIVDDDSDLKKIIFHPKMLPELVIADPELTFGLSPALTAATGMDALSHNLEAFFANGFHPMADGIAVEGIRLINQSLPVTYENPTDVTARSNMLVASLMGATAFQKGLGAMHALAHPLGATYDTHHGLLNAILMPYVLMHNKSAIVDKCTYLSGLSGLPNPGFDTFLDWVLSLRRQLNIPHTLIDVNIDDSRADEIAKKAVEDPSSAGNPLSMDEKDYKSILLNAITGS